MNVNQMVTQKLIDRLAEAQKTGEKFFRLFFQNYDSFLSKYTTMTVKGNLFQFQRRIFMRTFLLFLSVL